MSSAKRVIRAFWGAAGGKPTRFRNTTPRFPDYDTRAIDWIEINADSMRF